MPPTPEDRAREEIDRLLEAAGWTVVDYAAADIHAARGIAIRQFPLERGLGFADYLLYVDGKAAGVIEAKKRGMTLIGVEVERRLSIVERLGREVAAGLARAARLRQAVLARAFAGGSASADTEAVA